MRGGVTTGRKPKTKKGKPPGRPPRQAPDVLAQMWARYAADRENVLLRNDLIEHYLRWAYRFADSAAFRLPEHVGADRLRSAVALALIRLVETFEPERGFQFETFAGRRLAGAIADELRSTDVVPRMVRHGETLRLATIEQLTMRYARPPTEDEIADELGPAAGPSPPLVGSLSAPLSDSGAGRPLSVEMRLSARACRRSGIWFEEATRGLNIESKLIFYSSYVLQKTLKEIGQYLNVSESRIWQLRNRGLAELRRRGKEDFLQKVPLNGRP